MVWMAWLHRLVFTPHEMLGITHKCDPQELIYFINVVCCQVTHACMTRRQCGDVVGIVKLTPSYVPYGIMFGGETFVVLAVFHSIVNLFP